jgi:hypothetical protein
MSHADAIRAVNRTICTSANFLGEDLIYYEGPAETPHPIRGYVDRDTLVMDETTGLLETTIRVHFQPGTFAAGGVPTVREGVDSIDISLRDGEPVKRCRIERVLFAAAHGGLWTVQVEP